MASIWEPWQLKPVIMLKSFFKTTLRNCWKNKSYTSLNVIGLAIGIACAGLIFLWVEDEMNYDSMYAKKDHIYWIRENQTYNGLIRTFGNTPTPLAEAAKAEIPGIVNSCRMVSNAKLLFSLDEKRLYERGYYADASAFSLFTMDFVKGDAQHAFGGPYSVVITDRMARQFFGSADAAMGKTLKADNRQDYAVTGVIKDVPANSTLQLDWLLPFDIFLTERKNLRNNWGSNSITTYVELSPAANIAAINKTLYDFIEKKQAGANARAFLFPMSDWRLRNNFENGQQSGGRIEYVRLFSIIAWIILLIACINFMNLATARSEKRAREVGVRKVLGAARQSLIAQFIGEALFLSVLSVLTGMLLLTLLMPAFNLLVEKQLHPGFLQPIHAAALLIIALVCGLVAGSYPALYLSSFNPVFVFKGMRLKDSGPALVRQGLVVMQFTISIVLIISMIIIYQQIEHLRNRDIGYNKNNLLDMNVRGDMLKNYDVIRQELLNTGVIENVALASTESINTTNNSDAYNWKGKVPGSQLLISYRLVSNEYRSAMGMQLLEGSDFNTDPVTDSSYVIITESLAQALGKGSAIGKIIHDDNREKDFVVKGVIKNYVYGDMNGKSDPVIFYNAPRQARYMYLRSKPGVRTEEVLAKTEATLKKYNPYYPFEYSFVDEQYDGVYKSEALVGKLSRLFAALAILISCLGLFGLAAFTAERRKKEIGVRKVLGASVGRIAAMLSKDFLQLVFLSSLIAFPVAWWYMQRWLQAYTYRVNIQIWVFIAAGAAALLIALATIGFRAVRAGMINPVKSLRSE